MNKRSNKEYERLGQMLESIYETGHADRRAIYKASFIKGLMSGFGGIVGATLVVAILLWLLSLFDQTPLIGRLFENIKSTIENH